VEKGGIHAIADDINTQLQAHTSTTHFDKLFMHGTFAGVGTVRTRVKLADVYRPP
jgi:hypothetical protein